MLSIAGQTAEPNGLKLFVDTDGCFFYFFHGQRRALQLVFYIFICTYILSIYIKCIYYTIYMFVYINISA